MLTRNVLIELVSVLPVWSLFYDFCFSMTHQLVWLLKYRVWKLRYIQLIWEYLLSFLALGTILLYLYTFDQVNISVHVKLKKKLSDETICWDTDWSFGQEIFGLLRSFLINCLGIKWPKCLISSSWSFHFLFNFLTCKAIDGKNKFTKFVVLTLICQQYLITMILFGQVFPVLLACDVCCDWNILEFPCHQFYDFVVMVPVLVTKRSG